ncbi:MAG TPA: response regulator [Chitinophagaceae bacterium]
MKTIILVEDDESIRDCFLLILDRKRYSVMALADGQSILDREAQRPDLFILDKNISGMSGLDLCHEIKNDEKYRDVPVIMLSASPGIVEMAKEAGADDAIEKPFTSKAMRQMVGKYVPEE